MFPVCGSIRWGVYFTHIAYGRKGSYSIRRLSGLIFRLEVGGNYSSLHSVGPCCSVKCLCMWTVQHDGTLDLCQIDTRTSEVAKGQIFNVATPVR